MDKRTGRTTTDILVLGAGLAGFSAALAARQQAPAASITMVSRSKEPHGSSFSNPHNRLGIQVCRTPDEESDFLREAVSIAPPGAIVPHLTRILARESLDALHRLRAWGAKFLQDPDGADRRVSGCFSTKPRAYILLDLDRFFQQLKQRARDAGIQFSGGWQVHDIHISETQGQAFRVELSPEDGGRRQIRARTLILALGGQAGTLSPSLSGVGRAPGFLPQWCRKNKIPTINDQFTQFVWCRAEDMGNWNISTLASEGAAFRDKQGRPRAIPQALLPLFKERANHAPVSWGRPDRAIDALLMEQMDESGSVDVFSQDPGWTRVVLAAQVSNGGIVVDDNGWTGRPGLFACGECTGGMHGANRLGGAMVLSCTVFGHRAGISAANLI